jgi:TPR-GreAB-C-PIN type conflict system protein
MNKFAWRYMNCVNNWQHRFPGQTEIETITARSEMIPWSEMSGDFDSMFEATNGRREEAIKQIERAYIKKPIPIHAVADRLNVNDLQATFIMAQRPELPIKCCTGSAEELALALGIFERANSIVLDLTAIASLCMLGRLNLLPTWPRQFVITQTTLTELRRQSFEDNLLRLPPGFSASLSANGNDGKRADVQLKGLADALQSVCRVRDGAVLASIDSDRRDRLVSFFGRHGAESIVAASMPGHVLWTDDRILADLARTEFGVRRVWTEAALQARAKAGNLDPAELATASTKLAGWGYSFTTPSVETLMRAGSVAVWNPDQFPLKQALDQFASDTMSMQDTVRLAAELIVKLYNDQYLRGQRRTVTSRLLDRLATRAGGRDAIEVLPRSLPIRFGMDLIRARELSDVVRGWLSQSEMALSA